VDKQQMVLIIDDEAAIREAVADILSLYDIEVVAAADGEQGENLYKEHAAAIGLILLDLTLPGLSGEATFYRLREINATVPIIISSGYRQNSSNARFPPDTPFLPKPYDMAKLTKAVWSYLPKP
jgi:DNA-binding NtrC family response regulator